MSGYRVNTTHVVSDVFEDGEAAVIDLRSGAYYSLNDTAALLWPLLVSGTTLDGLVAHAGARTEGGAEIAAIVEAFVRALLEEGLVDEVDDVEPVTPPSSNGSKAPFSAPEVERFDDLQELLLLDPIHDVSEQGWPHTPTP